MFGFWLLVLIVLLLGAASPALAAEKFCSEPPYLGVIDGDTDPVPVQITIDTDCTFRNFPQSNPLTSTLNFQTNDPSIYLIIFDNVYYTGNMACSNIAHRIWFSNSSYYGANNACQDLFIPVETIDKKNPAGQTTAAIGVPFTYTLTLPAMNLGGGPSVNDLHSVTFWDDLTATGADLTFVGINAYYLGSGAPVALVQETDSAAPGGAWTEKNLSYEPIPLIDAGEQIVIELTVVLDDTGNNTPGTQFFNTAKWLFGRLIDGVFYEPLPGEWGVTDPMTIVEPALVVTKTGSSSVINLGEWAQFTIDVSNSGTWAGDAWNVHIADMLPSASSNAVSGGMCTLTPEVTGVTLAGAPLTQNTDYLLSYAGCELNLILLEAAGPIGPDEHLVIDYRTKIDADSESGAVLTNVAAAARWTNDGDETTGQTHTCPPTDGTESVADCQDAHDLLVALSGSFFEKTVANPATGDLVTIAEPGETLRYTLSLRSIDGSFIDVSFYDDLNAAAAFVPDSLSLVSYPAGADTSRTGNGIIDIRDLSGAPGSTIEVAFDITLDPDLTEGFVVLNQSDLIQGGVKIADSDDPNINGQADPDVEGDEDPTRVVITWSPAAPPTKTLVSPTDPEATIGQEVAYEIKVPGTPSDHPVYDVVITDTLDENLEYLGMTQYGGPAVTDSSTAPDLSFGVAQIPEGQQVVIEVSARVRNVLTAQQGVAVDNTASYTYANSPGGAAQLALASETVTLNILEPHISSITKGANPIAPAAGETVRYSVTLTANDSVYSSDVFDVKLTDTLSLGLVYAGNPAVTVGAGVGVDNIIAAPVITGDGINQAQTLIWSLEGGNADIDIAEGTSVTISYDVQVIGGAIAQSLTNSAVAEWTGIDGPSDYERDGSDGIGGLNDYITVPATATISNVPLLYALKTAQIQSDYGSPGIVDPVCTSPTCDSLLYTIVISNSGGVPATGVMLTDDLPANTTYVADSLLLNGSSVGPDGGVFPLIAGLAVQSAGGPGTGIIPAGESAEVTFEAKVNDGLPTGTLIVNQGSVTSNELPTEPTDADGIPSNGDQPTVVVVGQAQLLLITKEVTVVGGGIAVAGGLLEYVIRVDNIGSLPATQVVVTDDLNPPLGDQVTYVPGSGTLSGSAAGVVYASGVLTADYDSQYGNLAPGDQFEVRFRVDIDPALPMGTTITNTGVVSWNSPAQTDSASVSIDIGGTPGSASLNGSVWHDANLDKFPDTGVETMMMGWSVALTRNSLLIATAATDVNGIYRFTGLAFNEGTPDLYELRFTAPSAGPNTASMGDADSPFTNGPQLISDITVSAGGNLQNLNLPLWPNGSVYDSMARTPVAGATVTMLSGATGMALPGQCFGDPVQQNQVTAVNGYYKFDLKFDPASCPPGGDYLIEVTPPVTGYMNMPSRVITPASDAGTPPFSVPACPGSPDDAVPATPEYCEVIASAAVPPPSVGPGSAGTIYHTHLTLSDGTIPGQSQIFNNFIPIDPELTGAAAITKTSSLTDVSRGSLVPYTITVTNVYGEPLYDIAIADIFPAGFKYKTGSARLNGSEVEPLINGRDLVWDHLNLSVNQEITIQLLLVVGSGVSEGQYVNRARVLNTITDGALSGEATATVRVIPDPDFDCTDVIGKVYDDRNLNGVQDSGEEGLSAVDLVTARGLIASTDEYGRYHITCAAVPDEDRGSNFILKLDERSLPSGYRLTTENPRVMRLTRGLAARFNYGATIHRVVRMDIADGAFEPGTSEIRMQWRPRIAQLIEELKKAPSVLRLSYLGDVEPPGLVEERLEALKSSVTEKWEQTGTGYQLTFETEIFWRRGTPAANDFSEAAETHLPMDVPVTPWLHDPAIFEVDEGDRTEMRQVAEQEVTTIKLDNLVRPIHFELGKIDITEEYIAMLRDVLDSMRGRTNVRLHFVGHSDSLALRGDLADIYGDNVGLSRERAGNVAEYCQRALNLPPEAISYEGLGDSRPAASNETEEGRRLNRRVEVQVWYDEVSEKQVEKEVVVPQEILRIKVCRTETVCKLSYKDGNAHRARIRNSVSPLHYNKGMLSVPGTFLQQVSQAMDNLRDKQNLVIKFIAYTDNAGLQGRDERIYGDPVGLSKAVARRVALAVQDELGLPNTAIETEGRGSSQPVTSNDTQRGRALNRRVEVEFWHDDPLQDLPDEPQICPDAPGAQTVTRVYDSPLGGIAPILFENGQPVIPEAYVDTLRRVMSEVSDKTSVRLRFVGYTSNKRLDRRTAGIYGDDIGLSMARARRAMEAVSEQMGLAQGQAEFDGRGYVQSDDVVNAGFIESDTSRVEVQVVYDELIARDDYEGVEVTPFTREVNMSNPFALNLMRITVNGKPLDDPNKCSSDVQRCTDVALEDARIRFKHDSLELKPRLNVTAWPNTIQHQDSPDTEFVENLVYFRLYSNYRAFIERAQVRIFDQDQSVGDTPLAVLEMDADGMARWQPGFEDFSAPLRRLKYLVRVYGEGGLFDETSTQPLWVVDRIDPSAAEADRREQLLAGYGESRIARRGIPLHGGTVQAHGTAIPDGHGVWMAGREVPVDGAGGFVAEQILPEGIHTVEVAVLDRSGNGELFLRDLELEKEDWFTVGIADLTLSQDQTDGPAELLAPDRSRYRDKVNLEGRLAFYTNGKFANGWSLTGSADTREGPVDEIFSNFMDKSPEAMFRRIDPDRHYPTFGDDGTVTQGAPTSGKFYLQMKKETSYGLWGNFRITYTDTDLAHVDRGLYGANWHYQPSATTRFGEPRLVVDGFAADPGTVAGRDEFRGTDGSLYYLQRQDVLAGSERVRIEVRDKDSGMVLAIKNLTPVLDYDINYLQGRIVLSQPLPATADDDLLVHGGSISGNPVTLVVRYEFTPGFDDPDTMAAGGRVHYWLNDHLKVGLTASRDKEADIDNSLGGADLTLRQSAGTWIKLEGGRTEGPGAAATTSDDGGFIFDAPISLGGEVDAQAYRVDASVGFADLFENGKGKVTFYLQDLEAGYSAPGLATDRDLTKYGGTAQLPVADRLNLRLKMDKLEQQDGLRTETGEVNVDYRIGEHWTLGSGVRQDSREDNAAVVPSTQEEGDRTDAAIKLLYDSRTRWTAYAFVQETVNTSGNREDNGRLGAGGSLRPTDQLNLTGEVSGGDLGTGGNLGTEYLYSDRTTLYTNYSLENERTDNGLLARKGNMTSGFKTRYSDSGSVYAEERYTHGDVPTGLTHSAGVQLVAAGRLNFGANLDLATLRDPETAAELERKALGVSVGYGFDKVKFASALEYRVDNIEQPDASSSERTSWLMKNSFKYQLSVSSRLIGKFNYGVSDSSMGDYFNGDYTEAVLAHAYRPVNHDRLNTMVKYTYFYNFPAADQLTAGSTAPGPVQRSHIASIDASYDLTKRWTVGGKSAYRYGQVAQDRDNPEFTTSRASLNVLRAQWHVVHRWDALLEGRMLDLPDADDNRSGALVGIYRHLGEHIKLGAGYNFSDFSDDLTQLDYRHQGAFINLVGKY
ncbi:MAG: isopeptide-forming domain-containing fimbrial protein [bacterium]|nr:isopeptide-forming domain-containing fimbrial protein [bacterium]